MATKQKAAPAANLEAEISEDSVEPVSDPRKEATDALTRLFTSNTGRVPNPVDVEIFVNSLINARGEE
jgi:hypothetical protein